MSDVTKSDNILPNGGVADDGLKAPSGKPKSADAAPTSEAQLPLAPKVPARNAKSASSRSRPMSSAEWHTLGLAFLADSQEVTDMHTKEALPDATHENLMMLVESLPEESPLHQIMREFADLSEDDEHFHVIYARLSSLRFLACNIFTPLLASHQQIVKELTEKEALRHESNQKLANALAQLESANDSLSVCRKSQEDLRNKLREVRGTLDRSTKELGEAKVHRDDVIPVSEAQYALRNLREHQNVPVFTIEEGSVQLVEVTPNSEINQPEEPTQSHEGVQWSVGLTPVQVKALELKLENRQTITSELTDVLNLHYSERREIWELLSVTRNVTTSLDALKNDFDELRSKLDSCAEDYRARVGERDRSLSLISELGEKLLQVQQAKSDRTSVLSTVASQIAGLEEEMQTHHKVLNDVSQVIACYHESVDEKSQRLQKRAAKRKEQQETLMKLRAQVKLTKAELRRVQADEERRSQHLSILRRQLRALVEHGNEVSRKIVSGKDSVRTLKDEVFNMNRDIESFRCRITSSSKAKEHILHLHGKVTDGAHVLRDLVKCTVQETSAFCHEHTKLNAAKAKLRGSNEVRRGELRTKIQQMTNLKKSIAASEQRRDDIQRNIDELSKRHEDVLKQTRRLQGRMESIERDKQRHDQQLVRHQDQLKQLRREYGEHWTMAQCFRSRISVQASTLEALTNSNSKLDFALQEAKSAEESLESSLEQINLDTEALYSDMGQSSREMSTTQKTLNNLDHELGNLNRECQRLRKVCSERKEQINQAAETQNLQAAELATIERNLALKGKEIDRDLVVLSEPVPPTEVWEKRVERAAYNKLLRKQSELAALTGLCKINVHPWRIWESTQPEKLESVYRSHELRRKMARNRKTFCNVLVEVKKLEEQYNGAIDRVQRVRATCQRTALRARSLVGPEVDSESLALELKELAENRKAEIRTLDKRIREMATSLQEANSRRKMLDIALREARDEYRRIARTCNLEEATPPRLAATLV